MTDAEIYALPPGDRLDALIDREVFGRPWTVTPYSDDPGHAWRVVEEVRRRVGADSPAWRRFTLYADTSGRGVFDLDAREFAAVVCRGALLALRPADAAPDQPPRDTVTG